MEFDLEQARRAARGPGHRNLGEQILEELEFRITSSDTAMAYLNTELDGIHMTNAKGRNAVRRKIALLTNRRRTLIEIWEFATNRVWRGDEVEPDD